ncbi:MAG: hypothetical protein IJW29_02640 [Clostridia bacterium]|nr:hypothetical protein [Clostridia bacterium]
MKKAIRFLSLVCALLCVLTVLAACGDKNGGKPADTPEDAKKALKENGYTVTVTKDESLFEYDGMYATVYAYRDEDVITIHYFDSAADADAAWDGIKKDGYVCGKSDNMIWIATSAKVVKDAR